MNNPTKQILQLAVAHVSDTPRVESLARSCLMVAQTRSEASDARTNAIESLSYSVGPDHEDFKAAQELDRQATADEAAEYAS